MTTKQHIHIIGGTGQMGMWLSTFLAQSDYTVTVSGKHKKETESIKQCDMLIICVPIQYAPGIIRKALHAIKPQTAIIDLSSLMSLSDPILRTAPNPSGFVHFLFGPSTITVQDQYIVTNILKSNDAISEFINLFKSKGAIIHMLKTKEHDTIMAHIQALTHFSNIAIGKTLLDNHLGLLPPLTTPTFLNQTALILRVLMNNSAELLTNIQIHNPYFPEVLKKHIETQQDLLEKITLKKETVLTSMYETIQHEITPKPNLPHAKTSDISRFSFVKDDTIAYLGPEGTFSHQAATNVTKKKGRLVPHATIRDIFEAVECGETTYGLVPAENSTEGTIRETLDFLTTYDVVTQYSYELPIHQNLLSEETDLNHITTVISHPQGIGQTQNWLHRHLPSAEIRFAKSTVSDIASTRKTPGIAFICSDIVSKIYKLPILAPNIEDTKENVTKFYLISNKNVTRPVITKRTLLFLSIYNRVGILKDILSVIASLDINLNKIESRPSREKVWDYYFFIEIEIARDNKKLDQVTSLLRFFCPEIKILGSV